MPEELADDVVAGCRVRVRFAGRLVDGVVLDVGTTTEHTGKLAPLAKVVSGEPVLTPEVAELARVVADRYAGSLTDVLRLALPRGGARRRSGRWGVPGAARAAGPGRVRPVPDRPGVPGGHRAGPAGAGGVDRAARRGLAGPAGGAVPRCAVRRARRTGRRPRRQGPRPAGRRCRPGAAQGRRRSAAGRLGPRHPLRPVPVGLPRHRPGRAGHPRSDVRPGPRPGPGGGLGRRRRPARRTPGALPAHPRRPGAAGAPGRLLGGGGRDRPDRRGRAVGRVRVGARAGRRPGRPAVRGAAGAGPGRGLRAGPGPGRPHRPAALPGVPGGPGGAGRRCARAGAGSAGRVRPRAGLRPLPGTRALPALRGTAGRRLGAVPGGQRVAACRWCARPAATFDCPHCHGTKLRASVVGSARTAEELGRAFPGAAVRVSGRGSVLATVEAGPAIVVATPGAEPVVEGGYGAALLLDSWALLGRPDLRAAEETLRRWLNAAALVRPAGAGGRSCWPPTPRTRSPRRWCAGTRRGWPPASWPTGASSASRR
ncbi:primosome assembly protein PriA [Klenkia terrae]|uniref:primosomal protein N' family DNA-binding protein n=1 Tax=Klenkia terrae TaxID=1052259 RepID=UPI00361735B2